MFGLCKEKNVAPQDNSFEGKITNYQEKQCYNSFGVILLIPYSPTLATAGHAGEGLLDQQSAHGYSLVPNYLQA